MNQLVPSQTALTYTGSPTTQWLKEHSVFLTIQSPCESSRWVTSSAPCSYSRTQAILYKIVILNVSATVSALTSPLPAPLLLGTLISTPRVLPVPMLWVKRHSMAAHFVSSLKSRVNPHPGPSQTDFSLFISVLTRTLEWLSLQKALILGETIPAPSSLDHCNSQNPF